MAWFEGYSEGQYFVDPCKIQFVTSGIDVKPENVGEDFGIPTNVLMTCYVLTKLFRKNY